MKSDKPLNIKLNTNIDELQKHLRVAQEASETLKDALEKIENFRIKVEFDKKGGDED